ncbi:MAG: hypothetical protein HY075_03260 [Deltaproteobacteria bacterium]|nr:hypothetical protein [Deltaproteobacteria bacterium]
MTVSVRRLLGVVLLVGLPIGNCVTSFNAAAAEVWFYELRQPPSDAVAWARPATDADHHWALVEFDSYPYPGQLAKLADAGNAERVSLLFKSAPAPALAAEYVELARAWKAQGIAGQLKFQGVLPTADEARLLRPVCDLGVKVFFISSSLPTTYEAGNLATLKDCVEVDLAIGRYLKYGDLKDLKPLAGVQLALVNNYFPQYVHTDTLNLLENPVGLHVGDATPGEDHVALLNTVKRLTSLFWQIDFVPDATQYAILAKLDRSHGRRLSLRWSYGPFRVEDVRAWRQLKADRVQVSAQNFERAELRAELRSLPGEVVVETFDLSRPGAELR